MPPAPALASRSALGLLSSRALSSAWLIDILTLKAVVVNLCVRFRLLLLLLRAMAYALGVVVGIVSMHGPQHAGDLPRHRTESRGGSKTFSTLALVLVLKRALFAAQVRLVADEEQTAQFGISHLG